jgi:Fur family peroxide stress response transcriptional regulator
MQQQTDPIFQEFSDICRKLVWRMTSSRLAVYRYVRGNKEHPTVDAVWKAVQKEQPNISRESVYRILTDFAAKGLIYILDPPNVVARYDSSSKRHDHFFCQQCGKIVDFNADEIDAIIRNKLSAVGRIDRVEARVLGVCQECLDKETVSKTIK